MKTRTKKGPKGITIRSRVILALSALEEARAPDLFDFFAQRGDWLTSPSIRSALCGMKHLGWVRVEERGGEFWWSIA